MSGYLAEQLSFAVCGPCLMIYRCTMLPIDIGPTLSRYGEEETQTLFAAANSQAPTELRLARHLSGLCRLSRLTLTASGASHGIPDWVASLTTLRALDVRMECRCGGTTAAADPLISKLTITPVTSAYASVFSDAALVRVIATWHSFRHVMHPRF